MGSFLHWFRTKLIAFPNWWWLVFDGSFSLLKSITAITFYWKVKRFLDKMMCWRWLMMVINLLLVFRQIAVSSCTTPANYKPTSIRYVCIIGILYAYGLHGSAKFYPTQICFIFLHVYTLESYIVYMWNCFSFGFDVQ